MLRILIDSCREAAAGRWAEMLRGPDTQVWTDAAAVPPGEQADVVLSDALDRATQPSLPSPPALAAPAPTSPLASGAAVVAIGLDEGHANDGNRTVVTLPDDVAGRELRLVCRLLGRIVALERQHRDQAQLRDRLVEEAATDPLTGLPNRRAWEAVLAERSAARPCRGRLCLAIVDLDLFKRINDSLGHAVGDAVLRVAAQTLREGLRPDDFVARFGGDEYALLLRVPSAATAAAVVDRVRRRIPTALSEAGQPVVTASAGFHVSTEPRPEGNLPGSPQQVFAMADKALRQAKRLGRDRTEAG